jgi:arginyl-tRNA--protein-N-Asp/Glu arginylyltransferase
MKVYFDHIRGFGKVSDQEVIINCAYGILEVNESSVDALRNGWIPWEDRWYNERSTRLDLSEYAPSKTTKKLARNIIVEHGSIEASLENYIELHDKYCSYHGFKRDINLSSFKDCSVIEYHTDKLIGISLYKQFDTEFVAYQFIWDYEDPKLSLGTVAQFIECETAKLLECEYVYLLGGYELCCAYKSNFKGFEFWTGDTWSRDTELFKELVQRDEAIVIQVP